MKFFENICRLSQMHIKKYVKSELKNLGYRTVYSEDGFVFAPGKIPVLLCAHMDTVHTHAPTKIFKTKGKVGTVLSAAEGIGGDDRCGIYMVLKIAAQRKCSVLFLEDEEIGLIGATKFVKSKISGGLEFNYIMEFDRANANDAVFYECANDAFVEFIEKDGFYKEAYGSCSDISEIAPHLGCAAVNLSCGYYRQHTKSEYVVLEEMNASIKAAIKILDRTKSDDVFEYVEAVYDYDRYGRYNDMEFWEYAYNTCDVWNNQPKDYVLSICDDDGTEFPEEVISGHSFAEAVGQFLIRNPDCSFSNVYDWYELGDKVVRGDTLR